MNRMGICLVAATLVAVFASINTAQAEQRIADRWAARHARGQSWHAPYYHTPTGMPVNLVVPPTAHMQTRWSWGVAQNTMTPIYHQYRRNYPGDGGAGADAIYPTPYWPGHTDQFGVFYIRGPYGGEIQSHRAGGW